PRQGRRLVGIDLGHEAGRLAPRWLVAAGAEMQIDPAALELELVDLALAVLLPPGPETPELPAAGGGRCWSSGRSSRTVIHRSYVKRGGSTPVRGLSAAKQATSSALSGWGAGAP